MRFLVVYDPSSGMAELCNVGIFEAATAGEARLKACDAFSCDRQFAGMNMKAEPLAELPDGWTYFT